MNEENNLMQAEMTETEDNAPANETKAEKFQRLAPPRVNKVIAALESLAKLSARGSYEYTEEQVEKMFSAIRKELDECQESYKPKEKKEEKGFSF